jgi:hypothetical protein
MEVFGKGTPEGVRPLLPPGTCWICDQSPDQEGYRVIDTRRNARPGGPQVHESVRKYICEPCARQMGGAMGMVSPEEGAELRASIEELQEMVTEREMAEDTARPEDLAEMEAMAKKVPADQKATIDQSIADLKAQRDRAMQLTDMRERFGSANVDVLLQREKELRAAWTDWIQVLAGEVK